MDAPAGHLKYTGTRIVAKATLLEATARDETGSKDDTKVPEHVSYLGAYTTSVAYGPDIDEATKK